MANQISDLRTILFNQLGKLTDPSCNIEKEVARTDAIIDVSRVLVDSMKVEVDYMKVTGQLGTGFIPPSKQSGDGSGKH